MVIGVWCFGFRVDRVRQLHEDRVRVPPPLCEVRVEVICCEDEHLLEALGFMVQGLTSFDVLGIKML